MVGLKGRLADGQRPLQLHPRTGQIPKIMKRQGENASSHGDIWVVGAKRRLVDCQRPLPVRSGTGRVPKRRKDLGEVAMPDGRVWGVGV